MLVRFDGRHPRRLLTLNLVLNLGDKQVAQFFLFDVFVFGVGDGIGY